MRSLRGLKDLQQLGIDNLPITDAGLNELAGLWNIEEMGISLTKITPDGFARLNPRLKLRLISLYGIATDEWLARLPILPSCNSLRVLVVANSQVTSAGLRNLQKLSLESLEVSGTRASGADLAALVSLKTLVAESTLITDADLQAISGMPTLQTLVLNNTAVSDAGLKYFHASKSLKSLSVKNTKVTTQGVGQLHVQLPECNIVF